MAIAQSGQLGANATIKYTAARSGQRLRLIGFTPTGPVDITTRWNASTDECSGCSALKVTREEQERNEPPERDAPSAEREATLAQIMERARTETPGRREDHSWYTST